MAHVTLKHQISGTRDGKDWPGPGTTIEVTDDEAETLVRISMAVPADAPSAPADPATSEPPADSEPVESAAVGDAGVETATTDAKPSRRSR